MLDKFIEIIKKDKTIWAKFRGILAEREIASKTVLLDEGEISNHVYFIKKGCLRLWFNKHGKDITYQFFFEGQAVASIESFLSGKPGIFTLESIEPSTIVSISKNHFQQLGQHFPEFKDRFQELIYQRFRDYSELFLSMIKDTPKERYEDLITNHPEIIKRVPQHYIASYLGITPVSLSRIRKRK